MVIKTETRTFERDIATLKICDRCEVSVSEGEYVEWQEMYHIDFTGGYGSVFGDGSRVQCDLCQNCMLELIGKICTVSNEEGYPYADY